MKQKIKATVIVLLGLIIIILNKANQGSLWTYSAYVILFFWAYRAWIKKS